MASDQHGFTLAMLEASMRRLPESGDSDRYDLLQCIFHLHISHCILFCESFIDSFITGTSSTFLAAPVKLHRIILKYVELFFHSILILCSDLLPCVTPRNDFLNRRRHYHALNRPKLSRSSTRTHSFLSSTINRYREKQIIPLLNGKD